MIIKNVFRMYLVLAFILTIGITSIAAENRVYTISTSEGGYTLIENNNQINMKDLNGNIIRNTFIDLSKTGISDLAFPLDHNGYIYIDDNGELAKNRIVYVPNDGYEGFYYFGENGLAEKDVSRDCDSFRDGTKIYFGEDGRAKSIEFLDKDLSYKEINSGVKKFCEDIAKRIYVKREVCKTKEEAREYMKKYMKTVLNLLDGTFILFRSVDLQEFEERFNMNTDSMGVPYTVDTFEYGRAHGTGDPVKQPIEKKLHDIGRNKNLSTAILEFRFSD